MMINQEWAVKTNKKAKPVYTKGQLDTLRCPNCKEILGETDGTIFVKRCPTCKMWVIFKKQLTKK